MPQTQGGDQHQLLYPQCKLRGPGVDPGEQGGVEGVLEFSKGKGGDLRASSSSLEWNLP